MKMLQVACRLRYEEEIKTAVNAKIIYIYIWPKNPQVDSGEDLPTNLAFSTQKIQEKLKIL